MTDEHSLHVKLALAAIESYVKDGKIIKPPADLPEEFCCPSAAFVSLKKYGELRGCIGTIEPCYPTLAEEIIRNGICAATRDPRFFPVECDELEELNCSVDVLSQPEPIDNTCLLDPVRYGVVVENGMRRGLLLPNLEGVETIEEQIYIARRKACIGCDEQVQLYRFEVVRHY